MYLINESARMAEARSWREILGYVSIQQQYPHWLMIDGRCLGVAERGGVNNDCAESSSTAAYVGQ